MPEVRLTSFAAVSLLLLYVSRKSIVRPRSHGFFRFFAWEAIAGLILLSLPVWFAEPFSGHQIISWILLIASLVPLVLGVRALRQSRQAEGITRSEPELLAFERTGNLISQGIFRQIRHPLYCSLLLLAGGVFFKAPSWAQGLLALTAAAMLVLAARADECECMAAFGDDYLRYMLRTKMFIPHFL